MMGGQDRLAEVVPEESDGMVRRGKRLQQPAREKVGTGDRNVEAEGVLVSDADARNSKPPGNAGAERFIVRNHQIDACGVVAEDIAVKAG